MTKHLWDLHSSFAKPLFLFFPILTLGGKDVVDKGRNRELRAVHIAFCRNTVTNSLQRGPSAEAERALCVLGCEGDFFCGDHFQNSQ